MKICFLASILVLSCAAQAVVVRSSMNLGVLHYVDAMTRYKTPVESNVMSEDWRKVVRAFGTQTVEKPVIRSCIVTVRTTDYVSGSADSNVYETPKRVPNHEGICEHTSYQLGKDLAAQFPIPEKYRDIDLMVTPIDQVYGGKAPQKVGVLKAVSEISEAQEKCLADARQAIRDVLSPDLKSWLFQLGAQVSLHLDDNTENVDRMEKHRDIGVVFTGRANLQLNFYLTAAGQCAYPDSKQLQQILDKMREWSKNPVTLPGMEPFMFRMRS